jgi:hypothetical protein
VTAHHSMTMSDMNADTLLQCCLFPSYQGFTVSPMGQWTNKRARLMSLCMCCIQCIPGWDPPHLPCMQIYGPSIKTKKDAIG